jgi:hypothetical protein
MAKAQGISLNPSEITGMCGRLRCCLIYEYEQYIEARKSLPKQGKRVGTPYGEGKVVTLFPLKDSALIDVGERRIEVHREDVVPLEEWRALQAKATQECEENEDCTSRGKQAASPDERRREVTGLPTAQDPPARRPTDRQGSEATQPPPTARPDKDQERKTSRRRRRRRRRR